MKRLVWILSLALGILPVHPTAATACLCDMSGPFTEVAPKADLIVIATVEQHRGTAMEIHVSETLWGEADRDSIVVWGDNGSRCSPYVVQFPQGTHWVFALYRMDDRIWRAYSRLSPPSPADNYVISNCGEFWLAVEENRVSGRISSAEPSAMSMDDLRTIVYHFPTGGPSDDE